MSKQLAIRVTEWRKDSLDGAVLTEVAVPEPKAGEALVRIVLRPVNPVDLEILHGGMAALIELPAVPGSEGTLVLLKRLCVFLQRKALLWLGFGGPVLDLI